jgi:outer membrane protein assembly factor BamB
VVVGQQAYVGSNDAFVYSAELATGRVTWKTNIVGAIDAFAICNNTAFAQNLGLFILDGSTGAVVAEMYTDGSEFPTAGFAISSDRVLVSGTRAVYAIGC